MFATLRKFPRSFYVANCMEIFERMTWYGFYTLSTIYIVTPVADGGLGFLAGGQCDHGHHGRGSGRLPPSLGT